MDGGQFRTGPGGDGRHGGAWTAVRLMVCLTRQTGVSVLGSGTGLARTFSLVGGGV